MKIGILISLLLFVSILTLAYVSHDAEARPFSSFRWDIDETYHRDGHVQFVVSKGSENFLPVGVKGLSDVTVTLHPTINHDQTGKAKLPRGVDIYFEPDVVGLTDGEVKPVKLVVNVDENAPSNLYDVQIVGTWKEEGDTPSFMGSSIRLHVGHDFGDGKIPVNMLHPPLQFWKFIQIDGGTIDDVPCRNDYVLVVKHDGSPACVKPETKDKLIERDWTSEMRVSFCLMEEDPVCGVDGKTYGNLCMLNKANIQLYHDGRCTSHDTSHENIVQPKKVIVEVADRHYTEQVFPIRTTEVTSGITNKDKMQSWFFLPIDTGEKIRDWNFVTNSIFGIVDKDGDDAIDRSVSQDFGFLNDVSRGSQITCSNDETIYMKYRTPSVVEIKDNVTETYSIHSNIGFPPSLYKNETLKIASFFDQDVILPDHAILISNRSETCAVNHMGFTEAYYDEVVFQFTR